MRAGPGWSAASSTWVEGYVLALPFSLIRGFGVGGEDSCLDAISTNYVGSVDNQSPLALLYEDINASKGKWLGGAVGVASGSVGMSNTAIVNIIREVRLSPRMTIRINN